MGGWWGRDVWPCAWAGTGKLPAAGRRGNDEKEFPGLLHQGGRFRRALHGADGGLRQKEAELFIRNLVRIVFRPGAVHGIGLRSQAVHACRVRRRAGGVAALGVVHAHGDVRGGLRQGRVIHPEGDGSGEAFRPAVRHALEQGEQQVAVRQVGPGISGQSPQEQGGTRSGPDLGQGAGAVIPGGQGAVFAQQGLPAHGAEPVGGNGRLVGTVPEESALAVPCFQAVVLLGRGRFHRSPGDAQERMPRAVGRIVRQEEDDSPFFNKGQ